MRRNSPFVTVRFVTLALAAVGTFALAGQSIAQADDSVHTILILHEDEPCEMPGADENGELTLGGLGRSVLKLQSNHKLVLICVGEDIVNDSGESQVFEGFECATDILDSDGGVETIFTTDTFAFVSNHGDALMICVFHF